MTLINIFLKLNMIKFKLDLTIEQLTNVKNLYTVSIYELNHTNYDWLDTSN